MPVDPVVISTAWAYSARTRPRPRGLATAPRSGSTFCWAALERASRDLEIRHMPDLTPNPHAPISAKSIVFWRHIVGIVLLLLLQHGAENVPHFLGRWLGSIVIAFAGAGIISGFGYLFFTSWFRGKVLRAFVISAWTLAALLLFGQWFLPDMVRKIANQPSQNAIATPSPPASTGGGFIPFEPKQSESPSSERPSAIDDYLRREAAHAKVEKAHPGWKRIVATPEFHAWLPKQSERIRDLAASDEPADAISVLDKFIANTKGRTGRGEVHTEVAPFV